MSWELPVIAGIIAGLGVVLIIRELIPFQPHLNETLKRLHDYTNANTIPQAEINTGDSLFKDKLGVFIEKKLPALAGFRLPQKELDILRIPNYQYFGQKATLALLGLLLPATMTFALMAGGISLPIPIPFFVGIILAVAFWFLPDRDIRKKAAAAREEFIRALGAYFELVALERTGGAGSTQSLENAAEVGDSWVFQRLREELSRARWSGSTPWEALHLLSEQLDLSELDDLADIMRLSGEEGATVYESLRARANGLRDSILSTEHARANADSERMVIPVAMLAIAFMGLIITPTIMRMAG